MIDIRVIGTPSDVDRVLAVLREAPGLDLLRASDPYAARGAPGLVRVYVTAATPGHGGGERR